MVSLPELLRSRATRQADQLACRFLEDGERTGSCMTYADLDSESRALAQLLQTVARPGDRILLVLPPGLAFVTAYLGTLYAGMVTVVLHPPHPSRWPRFLSRVNGVMADAAPAAALTSAGVRDRIADGPPSALSAIPWIATDGTTTGDPEEWRDPHVGLEQLASLQYTSGSTSHPKGVMISHANLMSNLQSIHDAFAVDGDNTSVSWLPPYHDMGLVGGVLAPLFFGAPVTLLSPLAFIQRPVRWLRAISTFEGVLSGGPSFAYELCARKVTPAEKNGLDLSRWRVAFNGAEPVEAGALTRFAEAFRECGFSPGSFKPCYGLAEATLLVSSVPNADRPRIMPLRRGDLAADLVVPSEGDDAQEVVSCGSPSTDVRVVDPASRYEVPRGRVGEIWVSGPSVARGYWNRAQESVETFGAFLADGTGPYLRTGDLGFLLDGELYVTGRRKDLIIVDGQNHYPHDIERTVAACLPSRGVAECAAFAVEQGGGEAVVVVAALSGSAAQHSDDVARQIRGAVAAQHDLRLCDVVLVRRGRIPRTPSGKVQRHLCRQRYLAGTLDVREAS